MRYLFVVNPSAGRVDAAALRPRLEREFRGHDISIVSRVPARRALETASPRPTVVAVGGDGTVQRILRDVGAPFPCPLGVLPLGTANDLARAAGIPSDLGEACAVLRDSGPRAVDLLEVNGVPFATCGGLGLPVSVARRADRLRADRLVGRGARLFGRFVYLFAALLVLVRRWRPVVGRLEIAGGRPARKYAAILVSNQPILGGFRPSPDADPGDGRLDLCAIEAPRWWPRMLWITLRTLRGGAALCREVRTERRRAITIHTELPRTFLGDGEPLGRGTRFEIRVVPGALALVCPGSPFRSPNGRPDSRALPAPFVAGEVSRNLSPKGGHHEPPNPWRPERATPRRGRRVASRDRRRLHRREPAQPRR